MATKKKGSVAQPRLSAELMRTIFRNLARADAFDKMMYRRMTSGQLLGFYHPGDGALAPGAAIGTLLDRNDVLNPHHRAHGISHMLSKGVDPKIYLAEHLGRTTGCCKGRSSFHFSFPEHKIYMASGFIGFNFAPSVGWGLASKMKKNGQIVVNCSGDGSYGGGRAHEALLMAMNWKLPIVFVCENNGMAIHATASEMHPTEHISSLAQGFGMPARIVDGQDVFAVAETMQEALAWVRGGHGPIFVECKTLRLREHDVGTPDLASSTPRDAAELKRLRERDPVVLATKRLLDDGVLTRGQIDAIHAEAAAEVVAAEAFAESSPKAEPSEAELMDAVYAP